MTKEELKKEAEEKASIYFDSLEVDNGNVSDTPFSAYDVFVAYEKGALEFAEPREKRIAELEKRCANYEMTISKMEKGTCDICKETEKDKKIEALEQQVEKMKCCGNCMWSDCESKHPPCKYCDFNNKWELRR